MDLLASDNFFLAEKLRNEDPDQFYTLVRMHLSFILDLNADECDSNSEKKYKAVKWNLPFTKKQKTGVKSCPEGTLLTSEFIAQMQPVIEFLSKEENISQEGIFRRSGRVTRQQELKTLLHQGAELNFNNNQFSVHECATVLKNVLSELPESILTDAHYPAYCQIAELCGGNNPANSERLLRSLQLLILLLPTENRKFFQNIIELLHLAVSHEDKNRMSADNLATLFTPHLLCPRRLSPEALHANSQVMSRVVAFMIQTGSELFEIPPTVATDVRAYWNKKERRKLSPLKQMNESICDGAAASTVYTFVDRERTAQENRTNPTETALAQLYAYIQSLPESSKKRKLIKQFNKENGYGTPLRAGGGKKRTRTLNLGDSIKKHLTGFSRTAKKNMQQGTMGGEDEATSPEPSFKKIYNTEDEKVQKENLTSLKQSLVNKKPLNCKTGALITSFDDDAISTLRESFKRSNKYRSCEDLDNRTKSSSETDISCDAESTSRSQVSPGKSVKVPVKRSSTSPLKAAPSSIKAPRVSDEHLMPGQLGVNCQDRHMWPVSNPEQKKNQNVDKIGGASAGAFEPVENANEKNIDKDKGGEECCVNNLYKTPRRPISSGLHSGESFAETAFGNLLKTPVQKFNMSNYVRNTNNDGLFSTPNNTNRFSMLNGSKPPFLMTTSTPAPGNSCLLTPIVDKNSSVSPITKSTKRMPKAMQETMMTPRSRKPVISLSDTDLCNLANSDLSREEERNNGNESEDSKMKMSKNSEKKLSLEDSIEEANDSLSSTFRNYLFSRSVLTASPVDLSFSSRTDDFLSLSDRNSSSEENENFKSLPEILNEAGLSESLLYCLDGNEPEDSDSGGNGNGGKLPDCSCSFSDSDENVHHVYETAL